jgi:hypothetical protein
MASKIAKKIAEILTVNTSKPIQIQLKDELAKDSLKVITMQEPNKGVSSANHESLNVDCMKKAEVKLKQTDHEAVSSTEINQQLEVNTMASSSTVNQPLPQILVESVMGKHIRKKPVTKTNDFLWES